MNEYKQLLEEIDHIKSQLNPPAVAVTEIDHLKAKIRHFFDNFIYEKTYFINEFVEYHLLEKEKQNKTEDEYEEMKVNAMIATDELFGALKVKDKDIWDVSQQTNTDMPRVEKDLGAKHGGDCTGFSCTCSRCYAEELYRIPNSATWDGANGGHLLYSRLSELEERKKVFELANQLEESLPINNDDTNKKPKI